MVGALNIFQLFQTIPSNRLLLFRTSKIAKDAYLISYRNPSTSFSISRNVQTSAYEVVNGSFIPLPVSKSEDIRESPEQVKVERLGAFQKLPMVMPSVDIISSALRKARKVQPTKGIANVAKRERNRAAKQLDALMKEVAVPLRIYTESFPKRKYLHPYERSLIELTLGDGTYEEVLRKVDDVRKKVVSLGKEQAALCAKSSTKKEAEERLNEGMQRLKDMFERERKAVDHLLNITKTLRAMPVVNLETPTLCLVGAPNVGKSSLVRLLSTGKPEICNYPFTTRGILMGHIVLDFQRFQVTDTPGLLKRADEDRNNLEKLTLAVLSHLPTAVLYVHDLTGECGVSPSDQFLIYKDIKEHFSDHLWIDVVSKSDLLPTLPVEFIDDKCDADHPLLARYLIHGPDGAIRVSVTSEEGLDELKTKVHRLLIDQLSRLENQKEAEECTLSYARNELVECR